MLVTLGTCEKWWPPGRRARGQLAAQALRLDERRRVCARVREQRRAERGRVPARGRGRASGPARARGDAAGQQQPLSSPVTAEPELRVWKRDAAGDEGLVIACDGVWDVCSNADAHALLAREALRPRLAVAVLQPGIARAAVAPHALAAAACGRGEGRSIGRLWT